VLAYFDELQTKRASAFAMVSHARLGQNSAWSGLEISLIQIVFSQFKVLISDELDLLLRLEKEKREKKQLKCKHLELWRDSLACKEKREEKELKSKQAKQAKLEAKKQQEREVQEQQRREREAKKSKDKKKKTDNKSRRDKKSNASTKVLSNAPKLGYAFTTALY